MRVLRPFRLLSGLLCVRRALAPVAAVLSLALVLSGCLAVPLSTGDDPAATAVAESPPGPGGTPAAVNDVVADEATLGGDETDAAGEDAEEIEDEAEVEDEVEVEVAVDSPLAVGTVVGSGISGAPALPTIAPGRLITGGRILRATPAAPGGTDADSETDGGPEFLLPTVTPTPRPQAVARLRATPTPRAALEAQGVTTAPTVNLRGGPGTNYPVVGQARAGDAPFTLEGRTETGDWLLICCPAGEDDPVWISAAFVDAELPAGNTLAQLPVPEIPPAPVPAPAAAARGPNQSVADLASAPAVGLPGPGGFGAPGDTNPLTGQPLPGGRNGQRPLIVCINNDFAARPQLGTAQADVMYEYLMEGYGITRMSGIYYGSEAGTIGPVRSARLINYYLGALYDAGMACSGASDPVRYSLKHDAPFPYMDFDLDDPSATRYSASVGSDYRTRMRTSTGGLRRWLADWGVEKAPALRGFTFGPAPGGGATATAVTIPYPAGTGSQVAYAYRDGRYWRSMGGGPHVDGLTGGQLAFDNVVVQYVTHEATNIVEDSLGSTSIRLNLFGSNRAILFRDGQAFVGTWRSDSRGDLPRFYDASGAEIPLKPGRTFFSIVPESYTISYQ